MGRWKKPKPNRHDKDRQAGQGFLFETQTAHLSPWEKDELEAEESLAASVGLVAQLPIKLPTNDEIPF